jgi:hypothetical protein
MDTRYTNLIFVKLAITSFIILFISCKKDSANKFGYHVTCTDCDVTYSIKGKDYYSHAAGSLDYYFDAQEGDYLSIEAKDKLTTSWVEIRISRNDETYLSKKERGTTKINAIVY